MIFFPASSISSDGFGQETKVVYKKHKKQGEQRVCRYEKVRMVQQRDILLAMLTLMKMGAKKSLEAASLVLHGSRLTRDSMMMTMSTTTAHSSRRAAAACYCTTRGARVVVGGSFSTRCSSAKNFGPPAHAPLTDRHTLWSTILGKQVVQVKGRDYHHHET